MFLKDSVLAFILLATTLHLSTSALIAQHQSSDQGTSQVPGSLVEKQYKNPVADILHGTSFQEVSPSNYNKMVKSGENVVVFFYSHDNIMHVDGSDNKSAIRGSERMAKVFKEVEPNFDGQVKFLMMGVDNYSELWKTDSQGRRNYTGMTNKYGVDYTPSVFFYKNGDKLDKSLKGGPSTDKDLPKWNLALNNYVNQRFSFK